MDIGDYIDKNREILRAWGRHICEELTVAHGELLKVPAQVRVKDPDSARGKQLKKNYKDPTREMTDLVGVRFVVLTSSDLIPVRAFLESREWRVLQARDPAEEIARDPATFGYQSHHYEIRPKGAENICGIGIPANTCCEVQVRTLLQHAYAELTHDSMYKPSQAVPSQSERLVARSMALMETTDELLCKAIDAVRLANAPALAIQAKAREITQELGHAAPQSVVDQISDAFRSVIDTDSVRKLQEFVDRHAFVASKIRERVGRPGLFAFADAALLTYWLTQVASDDLVQQWPLPGSAPDVRLILSDMGIGA